MTEVKTVICPLDGSPGAERALPTATDLALANDAALVLFSAIEDAHLESRQRDYLDELGAGLPNLAGLSSEVVVEPHAPDAIIERAEYFGAMVAMATSTQPLIHHGYLGSAAERVVREATSPTLLVGPHAKVRLADVDRIVVPCDGSVLSEQALTAAERWGELLGLEIWVVTCLTPGQIDLPPGTPPPAEDSYVRKLAKEIDAQWEVLHGADPGRAIADWSTGGLIVMTTHGRSGLSRLALGSVTTATARWADAPVLVSSN